MAMLCCGRALRVSMDIVTVSMDMLVRTRRPLDEGRGLADHTAHPRQGQHAEQDEHDADTELHGEAETRRDDNAEQDDRAAHNQDRQRVTDPPHPTDHCPAPPTAVAA